MKTVRMKKTKTIRITEDSSYVRKLFKYQEEREEESKSRL
jgi:hypothetical protein